MRWSSFCGGKARSRSSGPWSCSASWACAATTTRTSPKVPARRIPQEALARIRAWEEAPLLDDLAINAGYRATLFNLGLLGVRYDGLDEYVAAEGSELSKRLGVPPAELAHLCRCLLDEMRTRGALSRPMLSYNPGHIACPEAIHAAEWERKLKRPQGYACDATGQPVGYLAPEDDLPGVQAFNLWRRPSVGGRGPSVERIFRHLLRRAGGVDPDVEDLVALMAFLADGRYLAPVDLYGFRDHRRLLQVEAENIRLAILREGERLHCEVCGAARPFARPGAACPMCHGSLVPWPDREVQGSRSVRRILADRIIPLVAREHTAQVPNDVRAEIERDFKAKPDESKINLLACSPTLEMGIDVGGLDAVALRNIPPRPDNYAQRGGRAGRRSRVGLVLGYARSTPHDQYFFDRPTEMIAGEVPAPALALGNRDVILRHLNAIVFSAAEPGLAGRMAEYVTARGELVEERITELIEVGLKPQIGYALQLAADAFGADILAAAGLDDAQLRAHLEALPPRVRDVFERTARQVSELRRALDAFADRLVGQSAGTHAATMIARLLGIQTEQTQAGGDADDRSAGYPLRRFAEFGILPGYEFPTEPASLRLLRDPREEDPITVARQFGLAQFQPDAQVFARAKRWKVIGLDTASPWNPRSDGPGWVYRICQGCGLRFAADQPRCPRCRDDRPGQALPGYEYGGFVAQQDEAPVLSEEERFAGRNLVRIHPQWDGPVAGRWRVQEGWALRLSQRETVYWVNEGPPPTPKERDDGIPLLHGDAKGFWLCGACGHMLTPPEPAEPRTRGRRQPRTAADRADLHGHWERCPQAHTTPTPLALVTSGRTDVLRLTHAGPDGAAGAATSQRLGPLARLRPAHRPLPALHAGRRRGRLRAGRAVAGSRQQRPPGRGRADLRGSQPGRHRLPAQGRRGAAPRRPPRPGSPGSRQLRDRLLPLPQGLQQPALPRVPELAPGRPDPGGAGRGPARDAADPDRRPGRARPLARSLRGRRRLAAGAQVPAAVRGSTASTRRSRCPSSSRPAAGRSPSPTSPCRSGAWRSTWMARRCTWGRICGAIG